MVRCIEYDCIAKKCLQLGIREARLPADFWTVPEQSPAAAYCFHLQDGGLTLLAGNQQHDIDVGDFRDLTQLS